MIVEAELKLAQQLVPNLTETELLKVKGNLENYTINVDVAAPTLLEGEDVAKVEIGFYDWFKKHLLEIL